MARLHRVLAFAVALTCPSGHADVVDDIVAAHGAGKPLKEFAKEDEPDPWIVADDLCGRGAFDAAETFAKAAPRPDTGKLPAYVAARRGRPPNVAGRKVLDLANTAARAGDAKGMLAVLDGAKADSSDVVSVRLLHGRGIALRSLRRLEESATAFLAAADEAERLGWIRRAATALDQGGRSAYARSDWSGALAAWERCLELHERRGYRNGAAAMLANIGLAYYQLGQYAEARVRQERARELMKKLENRRGLASSLTNLGLICEAVGEHARALLLYGQALELAQELGDRRMLPTLLGNIGNTHFSLGEYDKARDYQTRALELSKTQDDLAGVARALGNLGAILSALSEYDEALECNARTLELMERLGDRAGMATALGNIGDIHRSRGEYAQALENQERSLRLRKEIGDLAGIGLALSNIGNIHRVLGEHAKALAVHERCLELARRLESPALMATAHGNLGAVHHSLGEHRTALEHLARTLTLMETLKDHRGVAHTLGNIGVVHAALGRHDEALRALEGSLRMRRELGDQAGVAFSLGNMGNVYAARGDHERAQEHFRQALETSRAFEPTGVPLWAGNTGFALLDGLDRPADAVPFFAEAIAAIEAQRSETLGFTEAVRAGYLRKLRTDAIHDGMARAQLKLGRPREALAYLERGRAREVLDLLARSQFDPLVEAERRASAQDDAERLAAIGRVRDGLAAADRDVNAFTYALSGKQTPAARAALEKELEQARAARSALLARRALLVRELVPVGAPASLASIQRALGRKERMLFYSIGDKDCLLFVVPPAGGKVIAHPLAITRADLKKAIDAYVTHRSARARGLAVAPNEDAGAPDVSALAALLPPAVRKEVADLDRVYVVPHGPLHRFPLEALAALPPVAYGHSASVLLWCKRRHRGQRAGTRKLGIVAVGDAKFAGSLAPLPGTRREVEAIAKALPRSRVLIGDDATRDGLFREAPKARFVHLATHQVVERGGYDRLALTGGFLSLFELFDEWRDRLSACEVVVLSACETVKEPYAMPLGFLYAGAPAVIGSLWRVDDASTAELFADFYKRLAKGTPKLEAFTAARKALKKKYPQPYHWAAFIYIGDPR